MKQYVFKVNAARRLPDPVFKESYRQVFFVSVLDVPKGLPKGANPRSQEDLDKSIYKDIARSLLNDSDTLWTPNAFHLRNKGITVIAEDIQKGKSEDELIVYFASEEQGIVDGAHTYEIILENQENIRAFNEGSDSPIDQYVKFEIIKGLSSRDLIVEVAGGLNTAVQVQRMSLADLGKEFDWIKEEINDTDYYDKIAFRQGEDKPLDVRDVLRLLDLFNIYEFPNDSNDYPVRAYTSKEAVLKHYLDRKGNYADNYKRLRPILKNILDLHDTISFEARDKYNSGGGRRAGRLKFVESDRKFQFYFISKEADYRLTTGALLPMLGAFRALVEIGSQGDVKWHQDYNHTKQVWQNLGKELMEATQETSEELGRNPNAIGKSKKHWAYLHNLVLKYVRSL